MTKSPFAFSIWIIICVSIGFGLAYVDGVATRTIVTTASIIAAGVSISLFGTWLVRAYRK